MRRSAIGITCVALCQLTFAAEPNVWKQWRGPNRAGISAEKQLMQSWPENGPDLKWQAKGLGSGYSSVVVANGRIFTMGKKQGTEFLIALSQKDGSLLWETEVGEAKPNCTPTVDENRVYALGLKGTLICCDVETGREIWKKSFPNDMQGKMMSGWGYSESPLIDGNRLICTPGSSGAMLAALDKRTGKVIWACGSPQFGNRGNDGAAYSSPVISTAGGVKQYVQFVGKGIMGVEAKSGRLLWHYNRIANGTANIPTPLVSGDYVFCSSGYGTGAALLKIQRRGRRFAAQEVYFLDAKTMQNHHGGMIMLGDYIYCGHGHNKGFPLCLEWKTGKVMWGGDKRGPGSGSAAILFADGNLYFRYEDATMALIEASPKAYRLKGKFRIATRHDKSWPHPVIINGTLLLRDQNELHCYDIRQK